MPGAKPFEVKTTLSETHYNAMQDVADALGMTHAGYVRQLILRDIIHNQALVQQMAEIAERPRTGRNQT